MQPATYAWRNAMEEVLATGHEISPRGMKTMEALGYTSKVDMLKPIVLVPERGLGWKFMTAEAAWIMSGDNRVETIAPFSKKIPEFSDDGHFFHGAYGPAIVDQVSRVAMTIAEDLWTRQAVLTIWRQNPPETKDVPCTVSLQWTVRDHRLDCFATMRSSDLWLGWPYDVFNFTMITYGLRALLLKAHGIETKIGFLRLTAASQHLYERNWAAARKIVMSDRESFPEPREIESYFHGLGWSDIADLLWDRSRNGDGAVDLMEGFKGNWRPADERA